MTLIKAIKSGKEHRKEYRGAKAFDKTCRNHGSCFSSAMNRQIKFIRKEQSMLEKMNDVDDVYDVYDDLIFTACNLPKFLEEQMNHIKEIYAHTMNEDNEEGYDYAVDTMLYIIRELIFTAETDNQIFIHCNTISDDSDFEEFDIDEVLKYKMTL